MEEKILQTKKNGMTMLLLTLLGYVASIALFICSITLLEQTGRLLKQAGWRVGNIDAVIVAQKPKLAPYFPQMKACLARALGIDETQINLKGKTEEGLGFTGAIEGMKAYAVALLEEAS